MILEELSVELLLMRRISSWLGWFLKNVCLRMESTQRFKVFLALWMGMMREISIVLSITKKK